MTPRSGELEELVVAYGAGLDAELKLLRQLQRLAAEQREATGDQDFDRLTRIGEQRERVMAGLVHIEHELKPVRTRLAADRNTAAKCHGFDLLAARHRDAAALVNTIISSDRETLAALRDAEVARRFAAQTLETGETTLAAYRRIVAPPLSGPALVNRRG
jgi:hypothetical protein